MSMKIGTLGSLSANLRPSKTLPTRSVYAAGDKPRDVRGLFRILVGFASIFRKPDLCQMSFCGTQPPGIVWLREKNKNANSGTRQKYTLAELGTYIIWKQPP